MKSYARNTFNRDKVSLHIINNSYDGYLLILNINSNDEIFPFIPKKLDFK